MTGSSGFDGWAETYRLLDFGRAARVDVGFGTLDREGRLAPDPRRDLVITARMTYCFALGAVLGHPGSPDLARHGISALRGPFHDQEHGGWYGALPADGSSERKSAYPHAFVLLAAATAAGAGIPGAPELFDDALTIMDRHFWSDHDQALVESWDVAFGTPEPYWGANANMHGVEALLAAFGQTGDERWRDRALLIAERFIDRHARAAGWLLPEHYDPDWREERGYNADRPADEFRPYGVTLGHLLEWSRLLLELGAAFAEPPAWLAEASRALYDTAFDRGWAVDGSPGFVYTIDWDGRPVVRTRPHWVLAEAIGASATWQRLSPEPVFGERLDLFLDYADRHLIDHDHGSWHHELDPGNRPSATMWSGKPDLYHALQAALLTELPLAPSLLQRLALASPPQGALSLSKGQAPITTVDSLITRIESLAATRDRVIIGLVGAPGSGKSTLAAALLDRLGDRAAILGMDGFHLGQRELERLGRADRKGAPDTFDALGYRELLRRVRSRTDVDHFVPVFDRHLEEPIAANGVVLAGVPIVITEGNYLLLEDPAWRDVATELDECWYLEPDEDLRLDRLTQRHVDHGRTPAEAAEWVARVDQANAKLIMESADRATLRIPAWTP
ncbi:nucleoside/nucleotide kinase family protein [Microlunatus sp. GCM10028923]|uniref:nucleoside/nucleotide kinase family protein n=1 Tax=Microlunatus sp. GCM10028923 TaxID=3273400 RepID=UPI003611FD75